MIWQKSVIDSLLNMALLWFMKMNEKSITKLRSYPDEEIERGE